VKPRFVVKVGDRVVPLPVGDAVIGRSADCQVVLDDELVSRRHAMLRVREDDVVVHDLGSRNGVTVDGLLLHAPAKLGHGALLGIGSSQLELFDTKGRERFIQVPETPRPAPSAPGVLRATTAGVSAASLVFHARAALATPDTEPLRLAATKLAERLVPGVIGDDVLLVDASRIFAGCAIELARRLRSSEWLDRVFEVHGALKRVVDRESIESLLELAEDLDHVDRGALRSYLETMRSRRPPPTGEEAALLRRLEVIPRAAGL
jgi:pSer/pThr/pTyr-binding forkhead associated (FHA) protein